MSDAPMHALDAPSPAGLSPEEKLVWILGDLMNAVENYFGCENPKRLGHINRAAIRIIDEVLNAAAPAPTVSGEPVAWRYKHDPASPHWQTLHGRWPKETWPDYPREPLYTHPAPTVSGEPTWADESKAMHWIDRYAAGLDDEPQMDRILECVAAPTRAEVLEAAARVADEYTKSSIADHVTARAIAAEIRALAGEKP